MSSKRALQESKLDNDIGKLENENDTCIVLLTEFQLNQEVLIGPISSSAWDTACTSNAENIGDPYIQTSQPLTKVFSVVEGRHTQGSNIDKVHHLVSEPACTLNMVLELADQSPLSGGNIFLGGLYISICGGEELNVYNGRTAQILLSEAEVLKGWWLPHTKLW